MPGKKFGTEKGPYRDPSKEKPQEIDLPVDILVGSSLPTLLHAIQDGVDPHFITLNLGTGKKLALTAHTQRLDGTELLVYRENNSQTTIAVLIGKNQTFAKVDNYTSETMEEKQGSSTREEKEMVLEQIKRRLREELNEKKIDFAFRINGQQNIGGGLKFIRELPTEGGYGSLSKTEESSLEKTVFYSPGAGILRFDSAEPELNKKHTIYKYRNLSDPSVHLSILVDRTKKPQDSQRVTVTVYNT